MTIVGFLLTASRGMIRAFFVSHTAFHLIKEDDDNDDDSDNNNKPPTTTTTATVKLTSEERKQQYATSPRESSSAALSEHQINESFQALGGSSFNDELGPEAIMILMTKLGMPANYKMARMIVQKLDLDGNGSVSKEEFMEFYNQSILVDMNPEEKAKALFDLFDSDRNGEITVLEFKQTLDAFNLGFTLDDVGELLIELDADSSGTISLEEFQELIEQYAPTEIKHNRESDLLCSTSPIMCGL